MFGQSDDLDIILDKAVKHNLMENLKALDMSMYDPPYTVEDEYASNDPQYHLHSMASLMAAMPWRELAAAPPSLRKCFEELDCEMRSYLK